MVLPTKKYRSGVELAILRLPNSKVTDDMLSKGCAAGKLPDRQVKLWIDDIIAGRYLVVTAKDPHLNLVPDSNENMTS